MSKSIADFITTVPDFSYVPPVWTGRISSKAFNGSYATVLISARTKEKLCSGEMLIPGDQWPIFLYAGYEFDPEEPWRGLLRSSILISVRFHL
jgi:hypothetical protein